MHTKAVELYRQHNTNIFNENKSFRHADIEAAFSHESNLFNSIEDGISILDRDLNIVRVNFTMQTWYAHKKHIEGRKCYAVYHDLKAPCADCPIMRAIETGKAQRDIVSYRMKEAHVSGWHELQGFPVFDGEAIVGVVEFVKDITYEVDLYSKICAIEKNMEGIRAQNDLLKVYIEQKEDEKKTIENTITGNVKKYIRPLIRHIREGVQEKPAEYEMLSLLDSLFENIVTPYLSGAPAIDDFSSREIEIMSLIRAGRSSKEIAEAICVSKKTIDFHRANIRKKLGLEPGRDNLRSCLLRTPLPLD